MIVAHRIGNFIAYFVTFYEKKGRLGFCDVR